MLSLRNAMCVLIPGTAVVRFLPSQQFGNIVRVCQSPRSTQSGKPPVSLLSIQKMFTVSFLMAAGATSGRVRYASPRIMRSPTLARRQRNVGQRYGGAEAVAAEDAVHVRVAGA